jgi:hypothetical protein
MGVYAGNTNSWWNQTGGTDSSRIYIATNKVVQSGLVLNLDAGASTSYPGSGTTWTDLSGSGNNGTLTNGPTYSSANGGSIVFDGTNDYISLPNAGIRNLLSTNCTISVICSYSTKVGLVFPTLIGSLNFGGNWVGWRLVFSASNRTLDFTNASGVNGGNQSGIGFNYIFPDNINQFTHISCTWIASTGAKSTYVNGVLTNSISSSTYGFGENTAEGVRIASLSNGQGDNFFSGRVANTLLYNRALTAAEISQNFNALRGRFGI